jgi:small conductance mechanosensitive channel
MNLDFDLQRVTEKITDKITAWIEQGIELLPNFVLAVLIMIAGYLVARFIAKYAGRYTTKLARNETIGSFLGKIFFILILILSAVLALSVLNLNKTISSVLAGLGIVGLALGFAFQDKATNLCSGIYLSVKQPFRIGDIIEPKNGYMGKVENISLRVTKISLFDGPIVYLPNRYLFQDHFINYTEPQKRRFRLSCGISYAEDLEKVERVAIEAVSKIPSKLDSEDVIVFWTGFGDSSINFTVNVWMRYGRDHSSYIAARNESLKALKKAFNENGITIPFPIRTLDFGIKGGSPLNRQLSGNHLTISEKDK